MNDIEYPEIEVTLTGEDGNAFAIIGRVSKAIRQNRGPSEASAFTDAATSCGSYGELLSLAARTVVVN